MMNPMQLGMNSLIPTGGFSPVMPSTMGASMDINQWLQYLRQLMMAQNGMDFGGLVNGFEGAFPVADPGFGKGAEGGGGGGSIDESYRGGFSTGGNLSGLLGGFLGGSSLGSEVGSGMGSMISSLMGGASPAVSPSAGYTPGQAVASPLASASSAATPSALGGLTAPNLGGGTGRIAIANQLLSKVESGQLSLMNINPSQVQDDADALQNIQDAAAGRPSMTSSYGNAPGTPTYLDGRVLTTLDTLTDKYNLGISTISGASHSEHSRHYDGLAVDINTINGQRVSANHPDLPALMADLKALGVNELIGPHQDPANHGTHVHFAFGRDNLQNGPYTQAEIDEQKQNVQATIDAAAAAQTPEAAAEAVGKVKEALSTAKQEISQAAQSDPSAQGKDKSTESTSGAKDKSSGSGSSSSSSSESGSKTKSQSSSSSTSPSSKSESKSSSDGSSSSASSSSSSSKSESKSSSSSSSSSSSKTK